MSALIFQSNLCMQFWNYVVNFVIHLMNCIITFLKNLSPFEKLYNEVFDLTQIHVFGRLCYMSTIIANRNKLDPHVKAKIFLSFKPITKVTLSIVVSVSMFLNVVFYEDQFSRTHSSKENNTSLGIPLPICPNDQANFTNYFL